jgi:hypothetical protein
MLQNYAGALYSAVITSLAAFIVIAANLLGISPDHFNLAGALVGIYGLALIIIDITTSNNIMLQR